MSSRSPEVFAQLLREKWRELPAGRKLRMFSSELLALEDRELLDHWNLHFEENNRPELRGWYQQRYKDQLRDKRVLDFGAGFSVDGMFFAEHGAHVTFADIVEDNVAVLRRLATLKGIRAEFYFIDDLFRFAFSAPFDVILLIGSIHNMPFDLARKEVATLIEFLKPGGMVLMFAYPRERYIQSGAKDFEEFGRLTDGKRTPWCEWYDDEKVRALFGPALSLQWSRNFGVDDTEFNWFELVKPMP
jgi:predicted nicotinamide N-methyase